MGYLNRENNYGDPDTPSQPMAQPSYYLEELQKANKKLCRYKSIFKELQKLADSEAVNVDGLIRENGKPFNPHEVELAWRHKWARDIHVILKRLNDKD